MSTRWEHLAGDTGEFALKLAFARDPDNGQGADPDVGPSWGSFQLWVDGRNRNRWPDWEPMNGPFSRVGGA